MTIHMTNRYPLSRCYSILLFASTHPKISNHLHSHFFESTISTLCFQTLSISEYYRARAHVLIMLMAPRAVQIISWNYLRVEMFVELFHSHSLSSTRFVSHWENVQSMLAHHWGPRGQSIYNFQTPFIQCRYSALILCLVMRFRVL